MSLKIQLLYHHPGCGKTTVLRDMIRQLSNGMEGFRGKNIGLIDERSEISAMYKGTPQNDIGIRTDVMNNCLKHIGIRMMIRSMGSQIIATDEIGGIRDEEAIKDAVHSGAKLLLTAHGNNISDIPAQMIEEKIFETVILLEKKEKPGEIKNIFILEDDRYVNSI